MMPFSCSQSLPKTPHASPNAAKSHLSHSSFPLLSPTLSPSLHPSTHRTKQLLLQNKLPLLILFRLLVRAVVLPAHRLFALTTGDVAHDVAAGGHVALAGLALLDVDDAVEEEGFAVLAAEVLKSY